MRPNKHTVPVQRAAARTEMEVCTRRYRRTQIVGSVLTHTRDGLGAVARHARDRHTEGSSRTHDIGEACRLDTGRRVGVPRRADGAVHSGPFVDAPCHRHGRGRRLRGANARQRRRGGVHNRIVALACGDMQGRPLEPARAARYGFVAGHGLVGSLPRSAEKALEPTVRMRACRGRCRDISVLCRTSQVPIQRSGAVGRCG